MNSQKDNKSISQKSMKSTQNCTLSSVSLSSSINVPVIWEKAYISSKQNVKTEHGVFHYELVLRAVEGHSISHIKICPNFVLYEDTMYSFFVNPVDKTCTCCTKPEVVINWKEGVFCNPVLNSEELNPEEQLAKHLVLIENFIETEYLSEIYSVFKRISAQ